MLASNSKKHCSAHINKHHTPSMLEVGCRQLRRIDWAGRPICIFLFAFRPLGSSGHKPVLGGARAKRGYPLRGLRCEESATIHLLCCYRTIGLDARPTQRVAALCLAPRCPPPKLYRALGRPFTRLRSLTRVRLPPHFASAKCDCAGRGITS